MSRLSNTDATRATRFLAVMGVIAVLYFARDLLVPAVIAGLLTLLLNPFVDWMQQHRFPRVVAVIASALVIAALTLIVGTLVLRQAVDLTNNLPNYRENLKQKVQAVERSFDHITGSWRELKAELTPTTATNASGAMQVEVVDNGPGISDLASMIAVPLIYPLSEIGVTLLLLIFLLLYSSDLRERLIWVAGMRQMSLTTAALDEVADRIGRYLRMQMVVNFTYGVIIAIGLSLLEVPNALLWGVLGAFLRFVPFIGPWIAASMPTLLAIAVFPNWSRPLAVVALLAVAEFFTNMVMEPWLYGASSGMSTVGVVVAAVFWAWLWGPVGMIVAVPMTVCVVVAGKHIPQLAMFHHLFGIDGAVPDVARLYQRLLNDDKAAAQSMIAPGLTEKTFTKTCDELLLPVLCELKRDYSTGLIGTMQVRQVIRLLDSICVLETPPDVTTLEPRVLCVPAHDELDETACRFLTQASRLQRIPSEAMSSHTLASEAADRAVESGAPVLCIVQVEPSVEAYARHIEKTVANRVADKSSIIEVSIQSRPMNAALTNTGNQESTPRESGFSQLLERYGDLRVTVEPVESKSPPTRDGMDPKPSAAGALVG